MYSEKSSPKVSNHTYHIKYYPVIVQVRFEFGASDISGNLQLLTLRLQNNSDLKVNQK